MYIVLLKVLHERQNEKISQRRLLNSIGGQHTGLINDWLVSHGVNDIRYAIPLKSVYSLTQGIQIWRELGFMEESGNYTITQKGKQFIESLDKDWQNWPIHIPVDNNNLNLGKAIYLKESD